MIGILERAIATSVMVQIQTQAAITIPLKDPAFEVDLGVIVYANYNVQTTVNSTSSLSLNPFDVRQDRKRRRKRNQRDVIYLAIELLLERILGVSGRACLLRSICEGAANPVQHDSLIGELVHVLLTPSSTAENGALHTDYIAAEELGRRGEDCSSIFPACPTTPLDRISTLWPD